MYILNHQMFVIIETLFHIKEEPLLSNTKDKAQIQSSSLIKLFPQFHGNAEKKEEISSSFERNTRKY